MQFVNISMLRDSESIIEWKLQWVPSNFDLILLYSSDFERIIYDISLIASYEAGTWLIYQRQIVIAIGKISAQTILKRYNRLFNHRFLPKYVTIYRSILKLWYIDRYKIPKFPEFSLPSKAFLN